MKKIEKLTPFIVNKELNTNQIITDELLSKYDCVDDFAFSRHKQLTEIVFGPNLKKIGYCALAYCFQLRSIIFLGAEAVIDDYVCWDCTNLISVTLPQKITYISKGLFAGCKNLPSIDIPSEVLTIKGSAFKGCVSLNSIVIPPSVVQIGEGAFDECTHLTQINFTPKGNLQRISIGAFENCKSFKKIIIPLSVKKIDIWAFKGCENLFLAFVPHKCQLSLSSFEKRTKIIRY